MKPIQPDDGMQTIESTTLTKIKLACSHMISNAVLANTQFKIEDRLAEDLSHAMLKMMVPGKTYKKERQMDPVEVPLTWKDHAKAALGLKHKTRKIHRTHVTELTKVCPHLNIPMSHDPHLNFLRVNDLMGEME